MRQHVEADLCIEYGFRQGLEGEQRNRLLLQFVDSGLTSLAYRLEDFDHGPADRAGFAEMREQQHDGDGGRVRNSLNRALGVEAGRLPHTINPRTVGARRRDSARSSSAPVRSIIDRRWIRGEASFSSTFWPDSLEAARMTICAEAEIGRLDGRHYQRLFLACGKNTTWVCRPRRRRRRPPTGCSPESSARREVREPLLRSVSPPTIAMEVRRPVR